MSRIVFEVATANYLAGHREKQVLVEAISMLPPVLSPKKATCSMGKGVTPVNGNLAEAIGLMVPASRKYEGDIRLYGGKDSAEFGLFWKCGSSSWLRMHKGMPVNTFLCSVDSNCSVPNLEALTRLWKFLCENLHTVYGYAYLDHGLGSGIPRGQGFCLPRLHRYTFLGKEYSAVVNLSAVAGHLHVDRRDSGTFLVRQGDWLACAEPNAEEARLIDLLGASYFWKEGDCWRDPKITYALPAIDFGKLQCEE